MSRNLLCYSSLYMEDTCFHLLQTHLHHFRVQQWLNPPDRHVPPDPHYRQPAGHPVVEPAKGLTNPRVHDPGLRAKYDGCLKHRLVEIPGSPGVLPLPPKNLR